MRIAGGPRWLETERSEGGVREVGRPDRWLRAARESEDPYELRSACNGCGAKGSRKVDARWRRSGTNNRR